jgi:uncharacterized protein YcgL (UPF0745 family)
VLYLYLAKEDKFRDLPDGVINFWGKQWDKSKKICMYNGKNSLFSQTVLLAR